MEQNTFVWALIALFSAALSVAAIGIGLTSLPPMHTVMAATAGDTIGVWAVTWALVLVVAAIGIVIAINCARWARHLGRGDTAPGHAAGRA